jgi:uncharacterized membrane protein YeiH
VRIGPGGEINRCPARQTGKTKFENVITLLDWTGIIVFSLTGALVASRNQMDLFGFALRGGAIRFGWSLPRYRSQPSRS